MSCNLFAASKKRGITPKAGALPKPPTTEIIHVVRKGETLSKIASHYPNVTYQDIAKANNIPNPNNIYVGQRLKIPNQHHVPHTHKPPKPKPKPHIKQPSDETSTGRQDAKAGCGKCKITVELLNKLTGKHGAWFMGVGSRSKIYKDEFKTYTKIHNFDKEKFIKILNQKMHHYNIDKSCYHVAHFLAQIIHESAHFDTTLEYGSGHNYEPGAHRDAQKNGNTHYGDGRKYRGRGLLQLTWKNNYKAYARYKGVDFVHHPEKVGNTMEYAIDVSCWYWRHKGAIHKKYNAKGDINTLIDHDKKNVKLITLAVNGGHNGLADRERIFNMILHEWRLK